MTIDAALLPPVLPLRVVLRAGEPQLIPAFAGSALHGTLGRVLWQTVCAFPRRTECAGCPLLSRCAYPGLFATVAADAARLAQAGIREQAPRPLVLAPEWVLPSGHPRPVESGAEMGLRVTLIGRAIEDLAIVVVALRRMAAAGIGRPQEPGDGARRRYADAELVRITTEDGGTTVYDAATELLWAPPALAPETFAAPDAAAAGVEIALLTPLRLKRGGRFQGRPSPADFAITLARRANALTALYGAGGAPIDEAEAARIAASIDSEPPATRLVHVRRYSARQGRRMEWPGVIGHLRWRGAGVAQLWPLLKFGEVVQIGKGAALGFGRYALRELRGASA